MFTTAPGARLPKNPDRAIERQSFRLPLGSDPSPETAKRFGEPAKILDRALRNDVDIDGHPDVTVEHGRHASDQHEPDLPLHQSGQHPPRVKLGT